MQGIVAGRAAVRSRFLFIFSLLVSVFHLVGPGDVAMAREPNTTLKLPADLAGSEGSRHYQLVEALDGLTFEKPVGITSPRGETNRLFVVERAGRISVITNLAAPTRTVFLDISAEVTSDWENRKVEGMSSLAFHPDYLTNRFPMFYVTYTTRLEGFGGWENYNRLARFQSSRALPNEASASSELPLITQIDHGDGHNFNDLHFGADGYLYMAAGDEGDGGTGDDFNNAQHIDKNYFSGILRIDIDQRPGNLFPNPHPANTTNYFVPADNPWVGATNFNGRPVDPTKVRTEFYAVGLRNPWRMSFDPLTGWLYEGDVGQHGREEINVIVKGGNYGWSFREGSLNGPKGPPPPGLDLRPPIYEYSPGYGPNQGFSVTGGVVYRGTRLPELVGSYIFADYVTGNIWALQYDGFTVSSFQRLAGRTGIAGFGVDPRDGEPLLIDHDSGKIFELAAEDAPLGSAPPETLTDTGAFADLQSLTVNPGIFPYEVNTPFWSDGAHKRRWLSVPNPQNTIGFSQDSTWSFPTGTVWIKHFELTNAVPEGLRRLETRLLVKTAHGVYGVTYRWGNSLSNAFLVPAEGLNEPVVVNDSGVIRTQIWRYPSQSECLVCHTPTAGYALGFNTAQLNRDVSTGDGVTNQIAALAAAGYFQNSVSNLATLPRLSELSATNISREYRVRSYLQANCAACHQPGTSTRAQWDARLATPLSVAGILDGPVYNNRGDEQNRVITPGSLEHSLLYYRISLLGRDHMPPLATRVLDTQAVQLVRDWILQDLPNRHSFPDWQRTWFDGVDTPLAAANADPDHDGAPNQLEFLTGTNPLEASDAWRVSIERTGESVTLSFPQAVNRLYEVQSADAASWPLRWQPLDVPGNEPWASAFNRIARVSDRLPAEGVRLYRVTIREP